MKNAYTKDILRTIKRSAKRFLAIMAITALGLTAFAGITAACNDMYLAADRFYDAQRLFDVRVLSTLGLTGEDVDALQKVGGVETADGAYSETVHTVVGGLRQSAEVVMLSPKGLNLPYLEAGALPQNPGQVAVTQKYLDESGKAIGDSLEIEEDLEDTDEEGGQAGDETADATSAAPGDAPPTGAEPPAEGSGPDSGIDWDAEVEIEEEPETPTFKNTRYTITGVVLDPMNISNAEGTLAFRSTATADYTFFVTPADVDTEVYTAVYLVLHGTAELDCYSDTYAGAVQTAIDRIEAEIMRQRQQARHEAVTGEALEKIADAEQTMNEKFAEADGEFAEAWADIEAAKKELVDGEATLTTEEKDALQKLADARTALEDGKAQLRAGEEELAAGQAELAANELAAQKQFGEKQAELDGGRTALQGAIAQLKAPFAEPAPWPEDSWQALVSAATAAAEGLMTADPTASPAPADLMAATGAEQGAFMAMLQPQAEALGITGQAFDDLAANSVGVALSLGIVEGGQRVMNTQKAAFEQQIAAARRQLEAGRAEITAGWASLAEGEATLDEEEEKALKELADAWRELDDGKRELAEGEAELVENEEKYRDKKAEAEEKLADAYAELEDIDMTQWYVQDRTSLDSFSSLDSDLGSIGAIGRAFPVLFLVVAVLISLTTMTRMVEEERGLIGTYKALGMGNAAIARKYILYAFLASLAGGVVGNLLGFIALPKLLVVILRVIYILPGVPLQFDLLYGAAGTLLFMASNIIATALACYGELRRTPAALMRPKAPRAGSRILLERVGFIWNHLKFLNKVTARNLFRYKKRLLMTVIGIAGCTALVLAGFAIRDSVEGLVPKQYEDIYRYDLMVVADADGEEALAGHLEGDDAIADHLLVRVESVKVLNSAGRSESMQMVVVPAGGALAPYIYTPDVDGALAEAGGDGVLITNNAAELLGLEPGSTITLQNLQLDRSTATITNVVENYLGNTVFITQGLYETLFGAYQPNAAYAHFTGAVADPAGYADGLLDEDFVASAMSTQAMKDEFTTNFALLNYVIIILIVLAAGLAFVVLFTLSNTNISERIRELATIKVLGFFDREVHAYVNKETLILTLIGVLAGLPLGHLLSGLLLSVLQMPALEFALCIQPQSYVMAGVISFCFALVVNLITNRILDKINMVEALKSVE